MSPLEQKWLDLEKELQEETDFIRKLEIRDEILDIKRQLNLLKPIDSDYECEGCGS